MGSSYLPKHKRKGGGRQPDRIGMAAPQNYPKPTKDGRCIVCDSIMFDDMDKMICNKCRPENMPDDA
jgi:hypothetical protein